MKKFAISANRNRVLSIYGGALLVALLVLTGLLCIFSVLLCRVDIPRHALLPMGIIASCLAAAIGGFIVSSLTGEHGMLQGALLGGLLFVLLVITALLYGMRDFSALFVLRMVLVLITGAMGGYVGISHTEKRKRRR
ncbi:MAG: TIGR04086 family membrane protein [Pygmaiobacter sp.]